jgi:hypothetical protein
MTVEVRPWQEILTTLDSHGMLDALPFMPEMTRFCGQRLLVSKRLERTCEETQGGMKRIRNVVFLGDLRCDGAAHGGCEKACRIFWKDAWLQEVDGAPVRRELRQPTPHEQSQPLICRLPGGKYVCQATELIRATTPMPSLDVGSFFRDLRARTYGFRELTAILAYALYLRIRRLLTGRSYRFVKGNGRTTPLYALDLQPGEWVRVKPASEIARTLDAHGKNRGLAFTVEMLPFCGRTFRVLRRLEKMVHEPTCELIDVRHTVMLNGVTCNGCHILRGGCPRDNFHFWREAWLQRVESGITSADQANTARSPDSCSGKPTPEILPPSSRP